MKNISRKNKMTEKPEMITLDGYVAAGKAHADIMYARADEDIPGLIAVGDLIVCDMTRAPLPNDLAMLRVPEGYTVRRFRQIRHCLRPLRLVVLSGKPPVIEIPTNRCEVVGTVTHIVKTVTGGVR